MKYLILAQSLVVAFAAGTAMPAAAQTFDGPYTGVQAGWTQNDVGAVQAGDRSVHLDRSRDAATMGIFAGYNFRPAENVVLSAEGAINFGWSDRVNRTQKDATATINPEYGFDLGIRAGYLVTRNTVIYARGGYENIRAAVSVRDIRGSYRDKDNFDGWSIGGGVERAIADPISARLEYRYSDLGGNGTKFDRHQVLAGVAWHF